LPQLCKAARVPVTTSIYPTCHKYASNLLQAGAIKIGRLSEQKGHSSQAVTDRQYKHLVTDTRGDQERAELIEAVFQVERKK